MRKIKIGQIGLGHNHGSGKMLAVRKFPELFEIVGYAEDDENWIEKRSGLDCYAFLKRMSVDEIIDKSDAILVECDVCNLTEIAKKCVLKGKHVHVDKPASGTLEEFEEFINIAREKSLVVQFGYMYRYNFAINKLMDMINAGELGQIYQIDAEMSTYHPAAYRQWLGNFKGGSMYIFGSHLIDLVMGILGEPEKVHSFIKQTGFEGVYSDDNCFALLEYKNALARITTLSVEVNGWGMRRFAIMGSKGTVEIKPLECDVHMTKSTVGDIAVKAYADMKENVMVRDVPKDSRYDEMMKDFYKAVVGEKENPFPYERELAVQRTLLRIVGEDN